MQVDYILNPPTPSPAGGYTIQVTTKDPGGATIDSGSTSGYVIKQIQQQDIGNNQIYSSNIQDGQVLTKDIADNAITSAKIQAGQVGNTDLGVNVVTTDKIADGNVNNPDITADSITSDKINDHTIQAVDLASGAVSPQVIQRIASQTVDPGERGEMNVNCNIGEVATGGGYFQGSLATPEWSPKVILVRSVANTPGGLGEQSGWVVYVINSDTISHVFTAVVGCLKLTP